jgi:Luciferase-like monooxygenase
MKFGLHYLLSVSETQSPLQRYRDTLEQAVYAEALGFESVWPVEQHFNQLQSALPCPTLLLAAIASRTTSLRLGTAIVQLPLARKQSGLVDHAAWGGIHGLAVRASRMASMGRRPWLRALTR